MSENQNRGSRDFSVYDTMTTEELEQILRLDAEAPEGQASDGELLLYVMEVLAQRKRNSVNPGKTAQKAWESFQTHYLPDGEENTVHTQKKTAGLRKPWSRRLSAAAAVLALVVCLSVATNAFGWSDIWNAVAKWAKETFSFVTDGNGQATEPATEDVQRYTSLQELLEETNRDVHLVPTWIPEGYSLKDVIMDENPLQKSYIARYHKDAEQLRIGVKSFVATDPEKIEINEDLIEIYTASDIEYYIFDNMDQKQVLWIKDSYECYISGDLTIEEIKKMIDSIGKG